MSCSHHPGINCRFCFERNSCAYNSLQTKKLFVSFDTNFEILDLKKKITELEKQLAHSSVKAKLSTNSSAALINAEKLLNEEYREVTRKAGLVGEGWIQLASALNTALIEIKNAIANKKRV